MKLYDHICVKCRKIFQAHKKQQKYDLGEEFETMLMQYKNRI